jgi:hypothetical protein
MEWVIVGLFALTNTTALVDFSLKKSQNLYLGSVGNLVEKYHAEFTVDNLFQSSDITIYSKRLDTIKKTDA